MESGGERLYAARPGALNSTFSDLQNFLKKKTEAT
jgi:hypothetical protein